MTNIQVTKYLQKDFKLFQEVQTRILLIKLCNISRSGGSNESFTKFQSQKQCKWWVSRKMEREKSNKWQEGMLSFLLRLSLKLTKNHS